MSDDHPSAAEESAVDPVADRGPWPAVAWSLAMSGVTMLALGVLGLSLLLVAGMAHAADQVLSGGREGIAPLGLDVVVVACLAGWVIAGVMSAVSSWLVHEWVGSGSPAVHGLAGALVGAVAAYAAMMLVLGIDPVDFALTWL